MAWMWLIVASQTIYFCFFPSSVFFPDSSVTAPGCRARVRVWPPVFLPHGPQDRGAGFAPRLGHGAPHPAAPFPPPHPVLPSSPHLLLPAAAAPAPPGECPRVGKRESQPRLDRRCALTVSPPVFQFNMEQRRREQEQHEKQQELQQLKHKDKSQQSE